LHNSFSTLEIEKLSARGMEHRESGYFFQKLLILC